MPSTCLCRALTSLWLADVAEVLQERKADDTGGVEFYVHYPDRAHAVPTVLAALLLQLSADVQTGPADDKRLDEWVPEDRVLDPDTAVHGIDATSPRGDGVLLG